MSEAGLRRRESGALAPSGPLRMHPHPVIQNEDQYFLIVLNQEASNYGPETVSDVFTEIQLEK